MTEDNQEFYTSKELAAYFRVTERTIFRMMERDELPYYTIGGSTRFRKSEIETYLASNKKGRKG